MSRLGYPEGAREDWFQPSVFPTSLAALEDAEARQAQKVKDAEALLPGKTLPIGLKKRDGTTLAALGADDGSRVPSVLHTASRLAQQMPMPARPAGT